MATTAAQASRNLRGFIRWMRDNNVEYSNGLAFHAAAGDTAADIGVKARCDLREGEMIATIPKQACLTIVTSEAESLIAEAELGGGLGLAVALMYERSLGARSKWAGYLQLLPFQQCLPFVWTAAEIDRLLTGTELHKVIKEDKRLMKSDWKECYGILVELFGEKRFPAKWFSLEHFLAAKTLVASRAFEVDGVHGFGMVPLADLFNHKTGAEDVHFTSVLSDSDEEDEEEEEPEATTPTKDSVKPRRAKKKEKALPNGDESPKPKEAMTKKRAESAVGPDEAAPTAEESPKPKEAAPTAEEDPKLEETSYKSLPVEQEEVAANGGESDMIVKEEDADEENGDWEGSSEVLEMIMVKDVAKGSEIYNTYGTLSNAALLHRYGFTEPDNPFDILNVDLSLVIDVCGRLSSTRHVRRCLTLWRKAGCAPCSSQGAEYFEFSVDGKPQAELLVLLHLIHASDATREKVEKQALGWNADEAELSDDEEIERVSSAAVYKLAKVLGWTSKLQKKFSSRKRSLSEGATAYGSNKRTTPHRASVAPREDDPNPSWLTDFDRWLLTKPVCLSLLALVTERDNAYPEMSAMTSEKLVGGSPSSTLEEDRAFLKTVDSKTDPKLYHALSLRISERTILEKCAKLMKIRSKKR